MGQRIASLVVTCLTALALSAVATLIPRTLAAQSCSASRTTSGSVSCTINVTMPVADVLKLTLSATSTALGNPTSPDFNVGGKTASGPTATVRANRNWSVDVVAQSATFTGPWAKPASQLRWNTVTGPSYPNDMGASANLASGIATSNSGAKQIFFKTLWSYANDKPGAYSLVAKFTLSAP